MQFVTYDGGQGNRCGVIQNDQLWDLENLLAKAGEEVSAAADMLSLIAAGPGVIKSIRRLLAAGSRAAPLDLNAVRLQAPIPRPRKNIFCVGLNYAAHVVEGAAIVKRSADTPVHPTFFTKPPTTVIGPEADILLDSTVTRRLDYEIELGVIIGRTGKNISPEEALSYVFGYTIINDISARDLQKRHGQWFKGKALDTTCPIGPGILHASAVPDPQQLQLTLRLNDEVMQQAGTADMIFPVAQLISVLSQGLTLEAGDIIATGTPSGVGFARQPPVYLKHGDVLAAEIEGIGVLRNRVVEIANENSD